MYTRYLGIKVGIKPLYGQLTLLILKYGNSKMEVIKAWINRSDSFFLKMLILQWGFG